MTLSYTPPLTRDPATEGTWKSDAFWGVAGMDYRFDLSKSGSQWKISNARDLNTYCAKKAQWCETRLCSILYQLFNVD